MTNKADIFLRTRYISKEISAAILAAGTHSIGVERARAEYDLRNMEVNCLEIGRLLGLAIELQTVLVRALAQEPRARADIFEIVNWRKGRTSSGDNLK